MFFAKFEDGVATEYPLSELQLRDALSQTSLPSKITDECLDGTGYVCVHSELINPSDLQEDNDNATVLNGIVQNADGKWIPDYQLAPLPADRQISRLEAKKKQIRAKRAVLFAELDALMAKHNRQVRQGQATDYTIEQLDAYGQALADLTNAANLWDLKYPVLGE